MVVERDAQKAEIAEIIETPAGDRGESGGDVSRDRDAALKSLAGLVYLLQALSFVVGVTAILGVILNYARLRESRGTWLESHFIWQIRTFWYQLAWVLIGVLTSLFLVGLIILAVAYCWAIYRVAKGWLNLADDRPMYAEAP